MAILVVFKKFLPQNTQPAVKYTDSFYDNCPFSTYGEYIVGYKVNGEGNPELGVSGTRAQDYICDADASKNFITTHLGHSGFMNEFAPGYQKSKYQIDDSFNTTTGETIIKEFFDYVSRNVGYMSPRAPDEELTDFIFICKDPTMMPPRCQDPYPGPEMDQSQIEWVPDDYDDGSGEDEDDIYEDNAHIYRDPVFR
eukprot:Trichotokara_eunicae@DN6250_c1_g3_i1.p1